MARRNLVAQTLSILSGGVKVAGKDYFANLNTFYNDAKNVKNTLVNAETDVADTYARIKKTNITKTISDWFYQEETSSDNDNIGEEFDAGFKVTSSRDGNKLDGDEDKPSALTAESMSSISEKQTNTMLKIGRRQTEQSVANTAEIISTFNNRSSEIITSLNNINKTLLGISGRLDKIIELQAIPLTSQEEIDKGALYQDGNLSLMRIFEATKQNVMSTGPFSLITAGLDMLRSGHLTPTALAGIGIKKAAEKIKVGGKSFDDWGNAFNEIIGTATQTAMNEIINSKFFKERIANISSFDGGKDYGTVVPNSYDTKKAQFDGMTRYSIVNVIPKMLATINESISGREYHLNERGNWVAGPVKNEFNEVTRASFANSGISNFTMGNISNSGVQRIGKQIPEKDVDLAAKALTMAIVMEQESIGDRGFTISKLKSNITRYVSTAVQVLVMTESSNDATYWVKVCQCIALQLTNGMMDAATFVRNINDSVQRMIDDAEKFAQTGKPNATQATKMTFEMAANQFLQQYGSKKLAAEMDNKRNNGTLVDGKNIKIDPDNKLGKYTINQYIGGIFQLLNRGINVRVVKGKAYDPIKLDNVRPDTQAFVNDDTFGEAIKSAFASGGDWGDTIKSAVGTSILGEQTKEPGLLNKIAGNNGLMFALSSFMNNNFNIQGMKDKFKGFVGEENYNKITGKMDSIKDRITSDDRYIAAKMAAEETIDKLKNKGNEALDKLGHTRIGNNAMYAKDSLALMSAEDTIKHMTINDEMDQEAAAITKFYTTRGMLDEAEKAAAGIKNASLKKAYLNFVGIHKKRMDGQNALGNGETPDIGSVVMHKDIKPANGQETQVSLLKKILGAVGKIASSLAKLFRRGVEDVFFGLKTIGQGLFGYKDYDPKTGVTHHNKGVFRNLTTELVASMWRTTKMGAKAISDGVSKKIEENDSKVVGTDADGKPITRGQQRAAQYTDKVNAEYDAIAKGGKNTFGVNEYTRDANGKLVTTAAMTKSEVLKNPLEAVSKSLKNLKQNLDFTSKTIKTTVGKAINWVKNGLKFAIGWVKDRVGNLWKSFKNSKIGNFLTNNKITRGFTRGFSQAAQMRADRQERKKISEARTEYPLEALQVDYMAAEPVKTDRISIFHKIYDKLFGDGEDSMFNLVKTTAEATTSIDKRDEEAAKEAEKAKKEAEGKKSDNVASDDRDWHIASSEDVGAVNSMIRMPTEATFGSNLSEGAASYNIKGAAGGASGGTIPLLSHIGDTLGSISTVFGGFMQVFLGLVEMIGSIVAGMEGFQELINIGKTILQEGLEPLNDMFFEIVDMLKPITEPLVKIVKTISETVVMLVESIIDVIQPILEAIQPIIESVFKILQPILKVITTILDIVLMPIKGLLERMSPLFEMVGYRMQMISGLMEIICAKIMSGIGNLLYGFKSLSSKISGNDSDVSDAANMLLDADEMKKQGMQDFMEGFQGAYGKLLEFFTGKPYDSEAKEAVTYSTQTQAKLQGEFGAGDVNTTNITNNWSYTYGSGNPMDQHSYGNYMNMSERGCGPIALADAFGRRSGADVNPGTLAAVMSGAGTYQPNRGTSVTGMLATGSAMGMEMRAGGVTAASLRQASPNRPITVLGSGPGFGTQSGHNHYVNVLGTDRSGNAYVSNPMTGKVERQRTGLLVANSKLGLYGSGDNDDLEQYGFSQSAISSLSRLQEITSKITGMFSTDSYKRNSSRNRSAVSQMKLTLPADTYEGIVSDVKDEMRSRYPQKEGESDEAYAKRMEELFTSDEAYQVFYDLGSGIMKDELQGRIDNAATIKSNFEESESALSNLVKQMITQKNLTSNSVTGAEMAQFEPILHIKPTLNSDDGSGIYTASPLHDFFNANSVEGQTAMRTGGAKGVVYSAGRGGWFKKFKGPQNAEGEGSSGDPHEGVLLYYMNQGGDGTAMARAITGGTITYVTRNDEASGLGNSVKWRDSGGMYHWYMHMNALERGIQEGADIKPGQLIGYFGRSGMGDSETNKNMPPALRYVVTSAGPQGNTGDPGYVNPFTYWQFREAANNHDAYEKNDYMNGSFWSQTYVNKFERSDYHNQAQKAGLTGAQEAMIAAIGIHEDSAKKLTGEKSLTTVTQDGNGQTAFGIMNWIPDPQNQYVGATETKYGTTLAEQLPIMRKLYFDSNPEHSRARIVESNYGQYAGNLRSVLGHSLALKPGDAWGPLAEKDIAESMGHYVANALVPADWYTADGLGKRIGTAVDVYNWMLQKGWISGNTQGGSDSSSINGTFTAAQTNPDAFASKDGYFSSDGGAVLADYGTPSITKTNIQGTTSGESPLHEFFSKTGGNGKAYSANENWYFMRLNPDTQGRGTAHSSTGEHGGIDINWDTGSANKEIHATTGGVVDSADYSSSAGNNVKWLDDAGYLHWYMHMRDPAVVKKDQKIEPGQLMGYVGNTGDSYGAHLHYSIIDSAKFNGWSNSPGGVNPLMYFKNYNSAGPQTNPNQRGGMTYIKNKGLNKSINDISDNIMSVGNSIFGNGDSWADMLFGTNSDITSTDIPAIDTNKLLDGGTDNRAQALQQFVNKYNIKSMDSNTETFLQKLNDMTFNVRAKRVEELLEILIAKVEGNGNAQGPLPNLFNEGIPEAVTKLSIG